MKKRAQIFHFFLSAFLFILSGVTFMTDGKMIFGIIQILGGLFNLVAGVKVVKGNAISNKMNFILGVSNIIIAIIIALDYFQSGTQYLHFAWIVVAIISTIALWIQTKKEAAS